MRKKKPEEWRRQGKDDGYKRFGKERNKENKLKKKKKRSIWGRQIMKERSK